MDYTCTIDIVFTLSYVYITAKIFTQSLYTKFHRKVTVRKKSNDITYEFIDNILIIRLNKTYEFIDNILIIRLNNFNP